PPVTPPPSPALPDGSPPTPWWRRRWVRFAAVLAVLAAAAAPFAGPWVVYRYTHSITHHPVVATPLLHPGPPKGSRNPLRYPAPERDVVGPGQVLVEIDPVPCREQVALREARVTVTKAEFATEEAALEVLRAQVPREIEVAGKAVAAARAEQARDEEQLKF